MPIIESCSGCVYVDPGGGGLAIQPTPQFQIDSLLPGALCRSGIQHLQGICAHDAVGLDAVIGLKPPDCLCHLQSVTIRRDVLIRSQITLSTEPFSDTLHAKIPIPLLDPRHRKSVW